MILETVFAEQKQCGIYERKSYFENKWILQNLKVIVSRNHVLAIQKRMQKESKVHRDKTSERPHVNFRRENSCHFKFFIVVAILLHSEPLPGQVSQQLSMNNLLLILLNERKQIRNFSWHRLSCFIP